MDDCKIIELYFNRDELAIKETEKKYGKLCFKVAYNVLYNTQDSEECVSDTYLNVWDTVPPTLPIKFSAFLCKITRHLSLKKLEYNLAQKREKTRTISFEELEEILPDDRIQENISDEDLGNAINLFLEKESAENRNVFIKKYYFFESIEDISIMYGFSQSKVKSILFRMRNKLKVYLRNEGFEI